VDGTVEVQDGDTEPNTLLTLYGSDAYPAGEGDFGIPTTGTGGSHASAIGSDYIRFLDDTLSVPNITGDFEIISGEMTVETGLGSNSNLEDGASMNIHNTNWTYTLTATLAGERVSVDQVSNYLREQTATVTWTADEGSITFNNAFIQSPGTYTKESGNGKMTFDQSYEAETITVSN